LKIETVILFCDIENLAKNSEKKRIIMVIYTQKRKSPKFAKVLLSKD
jgi:hypothetical protein